MDDSTLSAYNPQLLGLYTPEWRLRKSIYVEPNRPAGVIMCEALWIKALYKNRHYYYSNQEEADYRMLLHASHAYHNNLKIIMIHANDTDVVVIAIAVSSVSTDSEIWITFGSDQNFIYIAAHRICVELGQERSWGLLFLHALSGCDTVSAFCGISKTTVWNVWTSLPDIWPMFCRLSKSPDPILNEDDMNKLERFIALLYNRSTHLVDINELRKVLFVQSNRQLENIPPSKAALREHIKRALFQAGHI